MGAFNEHSNSFFYKINYHILDHLWKVLKGLGYFLVMKAVYMRLSMYGSSIHVKTLAKNTKKDSRNRERLAERLRKRSLL